MRNFKRICGLTGLVKKHRICIYSKPYQSRELDLVTGKYQRRQWEANLRRKIASTFWKVSFELGFYPTKFLEELDYSNYI